MVCSDMTEAYNIKIRLQLWFLYYLPSNCQCQNVQQESPVQGCIDARCDQAPG